MANGVHCRMYGTCMSLEVINPFLQKKLKILKTYHTDNTMSPGEHVQIRFELAGSGWERG